MINLATCSPMGNSIDQSSYSNIEKAWTHHLDLELEVDFDKQVLHGSATHNVTLDVFGDGVTSVWFDIVGIDIHSVEYKDDGNGWKNA